MKLGAIVRSVGERTESLCVKSLELGIDKENIKIVKGERPFLNTLKKCYEVAISEEYDTYLLIDSDIIMYENWREIFDREFKGICILSDVNKIWEFTFKLKDCVIPSYIDAVHVINGKQYSNELLNSFGLISDCLKPEGAVRDNLMKRLGVKRVILKTSIGYHGYEQYLRDVFNRFYIRALRDKLSVKNSNLFKELDTEDKKIALMGWNYAIESGKNLKSLDDRNKIDILDLGLIKKERAYIRFGLSRFYEKYNKDKK